ncbi:hypothetical protein AGRA3207_004085 [Actinomadura graeca]|uniref:Uncharacterized protein n=1 Tax=Actinomadura graeca TaxID=2750812 RepID=A0ABX8QVY7_9ACTN|nr:hypothetical protein [Actinomadura graeca]QXJ22994.1 hypothetical protein AGRA3207_004085 [Actinomadura graeca]
MGKVRARPADPRDFEDHRHLQIETLTEAAARTRRRDVQERILQTKAELGLLISASVQYELDRLSGADGVGVIASVASVPVQEVWRLLSGSYQPGPAVWAHIQQILMLCRASQAIDRITTARQLFNRLAELYELDELLAQRLRGLDHRRRGVTRSLGQHRTSRPHLPEMPPPARAPSLPDEGDGTAGDDAREPEGDPSAGSPPPPPAVIPDLPDACLPKTRKPLRPDPMMASTKAMFADTMRAYRVWAGNPSYRELERRSDKRISYSTFRNMLTSATMPAKLDHVEALVRALGGTAEDLQRWATAWRRLAMVPESGNRDSGKRIVLELPHTG